MIRLLELTKNPIGALSLVSLENIPLDYCDKVSLQSEEEQNKKVSLVALFTSDN